MPARPDRNRRGLGAAAATLLLTMVSAAPASAAPEATAPKVMAPELTAAELTTEDYRIPAADPGIELFIRNKRPAAGLPDPSKVVLYVHGATYPAETAFDLKLDGLSWMDFIAGHGWDVYLVDVRGYGGSTRPPEMDQPADRNPPIVTTDVAARDVGSAVDHILKRRGISKVALLGWSWGTSIMGSYTVAHNDKVSKLVLYAPQWLSTTPPLVGGDAKLGAWRSVTMDSALDRWLRGVPDDKKKELIPAGWFDAWAKATWATDPVGARQNPPVLRAPNGVILDSRTYWQAGKALYEPSRITVPTLIVHAEWDADLPSDQARGYFAQLTNVPSKRLVEFGEGTHTIIMEKNRMQLFKEVQAFLDE